MQTKVMKLVGIRLGVLTVALIAYAATALAGDPQNVGRAFLKTGSPLAAGKVYLTVNDDTPPTDNQYKDFATLGGNFTIKNGTEGKNKTDTFYFYAKAKEGYKFTGWYKQKADASYSLLTTETSYVGTITTPSSGDDYNYLDCYAEFIQILNFSFIAPEHGSYTVKNNGVTVPDYASFQAEGIVHVDATPADGYRFGGWYTTPDGGTTKNFFSFAPNTDLTFYEDVTVGAEFVPDNGKALFLVVNGGMHENLQDAVSEAIAISSSTIVLAQDGVLAAGDYTIQSGITLYIPYTYTNTSQIEPNIMVYQHGAAWTAPAPSVFRKLILNDGVNITVASGGAICVGGTMASTTGGHWTGFVTGSCGVIDMSAGGHIEVNGKFYCWGFVKGQDMQQGNNTVGVGTITANAGATVWENFTCGDWRGGSACLNISNKQSTWRFFPFQSYSVQNIEVPTTYKYGAKLSNYLNVFGDGQTNSSTFDIIGSSNTLFLLTDANSKLEKWYDPTTDLVCYQMSGTTQLNALIVKVQGTTISSGDYNLPIANNMQIIIKDNLSLTRPMTMQAGSVIEIKDGANVTLSTNLYMYDKDEWGVYANDRYFYSFPNLTSHKDRGNETSNAHLDDARLIVNGSMNVTSTGKIYSTNGGADITGNGGGRLSFAGSLPGNNGTLYACTGVDTVATNTISAANLHNEDGSYTKSAALTTFHNVNGRWFAASAKDEKADHTYNFTYISSGAVSGTTGTNTTTDALYGADKTGLLSGMKWANVTLDGTCPDIYNATQNLNGVSASNIRYTYLSDAWLQLRKTETTGLYSGSDNNLYGLDGCTFSALGSVDEDCLYEIESVKKALVNGTFIQMVQNTEDAAYHNAANASDYYICFEGCNWHPATKYAGEEKAYTVGGQTYIWYDGNWLPVEREDAYFMDYNAQNVKRFYEYENGNWQLASPRIRVIDAYETRDFHYLPEAFAVALVKKNATIMLLKDITGIAEPLVYTAQNATCTLDLNGHTLSGTCANMLTVDATGATLIITDNSGSGNGEMRACPSDNSRLSGYSVQSGTLELRGGKLYATNAMTKDNTNASVRMTGVQVAVGATFNMTGGTIECEDETAPYGILVEGTASNKGTMNMNAGELIVRSTAGAEPNGVRLECGRLNLSGTASIASYASSSNAYGIYVAATGTYGAELYMSGGDVFAQSTTAAKGIEVQADVIITRDYSSANPSAQVDNTPKSWGYGKAEISGGTITSNTTTSNISYAVSSYGMTTITGGTITATAKTGPSSGVRTSGGITTITDGVTVSATAPSSAYAVSCTGTINKPRGWLNEGVLNIEGGEYFATTTSTTTAYGISVSLDPQTINNTAAATAGFNGGYVAQGTVNVRGGMFTVKAKTSTAYGIYFVYGNVTRGSMTKSPKCTVYDGIFKVSGTGTLGAVGKGGTLSTDSCQLYGGYYNRTENLSTYAVAPATMITLTAADAHYNADYKYHIGQMYTVTFMDGSTQLQRGRVDVGEVPEYTGETRAATAQYSYTLDGWSTTVDGEVLESLPPVSASATYYAQYTPVPRDYAVTLHTNEGTINAGNVASYTYGTGATLPTDVTRTNHRFDGWFDNSSCTGSPVTAIANTATGDKEYWAKWTEYEASVTVNEITERYTSFTDAFDDAKEQDEAVIMLLKNVSGIASSLSYTKTDATCTLDLNGHTLSGTCANMLTVNAAGSTFFITDNSNEEPTGEIRACPSANSRLVGYAVQAGTLELRAGKMYATNNLTKDNTNTAVRITGMQVSAGATFNMTGGTFECEDESTPYGILVDGTASNKGVMNMSAGELIVRATAGAEPNGVRLAYGRLNLSGTASIDSRATSSTAYGVYVHANGSYGGELFMSGGSIYAKGTTQIRGVQIEANVTGTSSSPTVRGYGRAEISGGIITAEGTQSNANTAGVLSYGTTLISGGTISANALAADGTTVYGVRTMGGTTTISDGAIIKSKATSKAYALSCTGAVNSSYGWKHEGVMDIEGGDFTATSTSGTTAYGISLSLEQKTVNSTGYIAVGTVYVRGGEFKVDAKTTISYGVFFVYGTRTQGAVTASPKCFIYGGKFKMSGTGTLGVIDNVRSTGAVSTDNCKIHGGYFSHNGNLATYKASTATSTTLTSSHPEYANGYRYLVEENYSVTLHPNGGTINSGDITAYSYGIGAALPTDVTRDKYVFDGWFDNSECAGSAVTEIANTESGNKEYWANWSEVEAYVTVDENTIPYASFTEAFAYAKTQENATIQLAKDISGIASTLAYTTANTTCTLDLNGHTLSGSCANMLVVNAAGSTFIITDNSSEEPIGEISACPSANSRQTAYAVQVGTLELRAGKMYATNAMTRQSGSVNAAVRITGLDISAGATFNMTGGTFECEDEMAPYGVLIQGNATHKGEMNMSGGNLIVRANNWDSPNGVRLDCGRLNISGTASIASRANTSNAYGVYVCATGTYGGEVYMSGGTVLARCTTASRGIQIDANATATSSTPSSRGYGKAVISGGNITAESTASGGNAAGVLSYGTTTISGDTIKAIVSGAGPNAYGVRTLGGTTTITDGATVIATAPYQAYALSCTGAVNATYGWKHEGVINVEGGKLSATTTSGTTAYGASIAGEKKTVSSVDYVAVGTVNIQGGEFEIKAKTTTAYAVYFVYPTTTYPAKCTIRGGKFKVSGTGSLGVIGKGSTLSTDNCKIYGGCYNRNENLSSYVVAPASIITLTNTDPNYPEYKYMVAEQCTDLVVDAEHIIEHNTTATTTTVETGGTLIVESGNTLTTQNLVLEATPNASGEILGEVSATQHAYFDFSQPGGFQARKWYAVAVPWQVDVPWNAGYTQTCGISAKTGEGEFIPLALGRQIDLIYYNGALRAAQGHTDECWRYVEDDGQTEVMMPGKAYMFYLLNTADVLRFERKDGEDLLNTTLSVETYDLGTDDSKDANWNGIANPALYHAFINPAADTYEDTENAGQVYDAETRTYSVVNLSSTSLVVGQPVFVQATTASSSVVANPSHEVAAPYFAPRRVQGQGNPLTRYEVLFAASDEENADRIIIRMNEDKEKDTYIIGQDLVKMDVSDRVPQMWIDRYDSRMCIHTALPVSDKADYPLGLFAPKDGEYDLFIESQPDNNTLLYLTYDGETIWNLSYGGYVATLEKGTNAHYGLRIITKAPQVATGMDEAIVEAQGETRKVLIDGIIYIQREGCIYSVIGEKIQ